MVMSGSTQCRHKCVVDTYPVALLHVALMQLPYAALEFLWFLYEGYAVVELCLEPTNIGLYVLNLSRKRDTHTDSR